MTTDLVALLHKHQKVEGWGDCECSGYGRIKEASYEAHIAAVVASFVAARVAEAKADGAAEVGRAIDQLADQLVLSDGGAGTALTSAILQKCVQIAGQVEQRLRDDGSK